MAPSATGARSPRTAVWLACAALAAVGLAVWGYTRWCGLDEVAVRAAVRAGRSGEARTALARWLRRAPDSAEAQLWRARLAIADRRPDEAAKALTRAVALGAPRPRIQRLHATAAALAGRFEEAEPYLRAAFNEGGAPDPLLDEALSKIYLETYDLPRARAALSRWALDAPNDPRPHLWLAEADARMGDSSAPLNDYLEALRRDPACAQARLGLAEILRKTHRNAEAADSYAAYLALKPDAAAGHLGCGQNATELGDHDAASRHLERAVALAPNDPEAHRALAYVLTRQRNDAVALEHLDRAKAIDPYDVETLYARSLILTRLGRHDEAKADQARAATLRAELADLVAARATLVRSPHDTATRLAIARWMFSHGKAAEGVHWAESILRDHQGQPDACRLLTDHYARSGQNGLANLYRVQAAAQP